MFVRTLALMLASALATVGLLVPSTAPATATPDNFTPRQGATFNNPLAGRHKQKAIFRKIIRSINSSPRRSEINIFSWNFLTQEGADALIRAARRGVRVRLIMDDINTKRIDNPPYRRLKRELRQESRGEKRSRRGWARLCEGTCRGGGGAAHSKFFTFSRVGKARNVVIQGSANFTIASTTNQWNDIYTHKGKRVYRFATRVFKEASRDKRARDPYATRNFRNFRLMMFPNTGKRSPDPVMQMLKRVRCTGATNVRSGRTWLWIAPDVVRNKRGMRLAEQLIKLHNQGCRIRLGYTVMGIAHGRKLRAAGVPMKHLVQDFDGDGQFDNYFHMKAMTIVGNYGGDRSAHVALNGSANWSGLGMVSDENLAILHKRKDVRRYEEHISYWYKNFPSSAFRTSARGSAPAIDPDRLVFGYGPDAVYEDGEPVSTDGTDPFATVPLD